VTRVKGFVLAAGFGQRLRPITEVIPKPLLPVGNVPLIGYALRLCAHHGITEVIVNLHHLGSLIEETLGDGEAFGVHITYSTEEEILGTGGGLRRMHALLEDDTFVVLNADTILEVDLGALIAQHRERGALATLVLRQDPRQAEFGQLEIDDSGRLRRILGQGEADQPLHPYMFAGVHVIEPRFLEYIPPDVNTCIMRYAYTKALANGEPLYGAAMRGYWSDAGTPRRYLEANLDALERRMALTHVDPLAGFALTPKRAVDEVVRMGNDVALGVGVDIRAPVLLGDGARVADNAVVGPGCVVGARAQVGKGARLSRTVVLEGARVEPSVHLDGAIVAKRVSVTDVFATPGD
jgi:NDP-sugar pyrophosphorylase family protein